MRALNKDVALAVLTEEDPLKALPIAKSLNAIAINPYYLTLSKENVQALQDEGFKVYTWTVNEPEDIEKMKNLGVNGIFTDFPERAN
jgi:glycerophosphoryl diester phosphodiesterase